MKHFLFGFVLSKLFFPLSLVAAETVVEAAKPILYRQGQVEGVIFPASKKSFLYDAESAWTPSLADIEKLEKQLPEALKKYAIKDPKRKWYDYHADCAVKILEELPTFKRQYSGIVRKNKKIITINFLYGKSVEYEKWKEHIIIVDDGGWHYFEMEFDADKQEFISFRANGVG